MDSIVLTQDESLSMIGPLTLAVLAERPQNLDCYRPLASKVFDFDLYNVLSRYHNEAKKTTRHVRLEKGSG